MASYKIKILVAFLLQGFVYAQYKSGGVDLLTKDANKNDRFGRAVALSNNILAAAAKHTNGPVYVFRHKSNHLLFGDQPFASSSSFIFSGWEQIHKLSPKKNDSYDNLFGSSIAISGNNVLVGTSGGYAYVFNIGGQKVTWQRLSFSLPSYPKRKVKKKAYRKVLGKKTGGTNIYKSVVSIDGERAVIGTSIHKYHKKHDTNLATVFRLNNNIWEKEQVLEKRSKGDYSTSAVRVAIKKDVAVVMSSKYTVNTGHTVSANVYRHTGNGWTKEQKLSPLGQNGKYSSIKEISISNNLITLATDTAIYVYRNNGNTWVEEQKITPPNQFTGFSFSNPVSVGDNLIAIGANTNNEKGPAAGTVYIYEYNGSSWVKKTSLFPNSKGDARFGASVSFDGKKLAVGAPQHPYSRKRIHYIGSGRVYLYDFSAWTKKDMQNLFPNLKGWKTSQLKIKELKPFTEASGLDGMLNSSQSIFLKNGNAKKGNKKIEYELLKEYNNSKDGNNISVFIYSENINLIGMILLAHGYEIKKGKFVPFTDTKQKQLQKKILDSGTKKFTFKGRLGIKSRIKGRLNYILGIGKSGVIALSAESGANPEPIMNALDFTALDLFSKFDHLKELK